GFLLMFLAGPKIKNLHASMLASDFQPFDPGIMSIKLITEIREKILRCGDIFSFRVRRLL
ncbi:MAG: hypothetical protein ACLTXS_17695, partial [[Clostridium] symbiosum]